MVVSFIGGGNRKTRWKPFSCRSDWELLHIYVGGRRNRDRMVGGFTTTCAISTDHHWCCEFESRSGRGAQHYVIKCVSDLRQENGFTITVTTDPYINMQQFSVRKFKKYISQTCHNPEGNQLGSPNCAYSFACRFGRHPHPQIPCTNVPHSYL
jgi:hypothetical protein